MMMMMIIMMMMMMLMMMMMMMMMTTMMVYFFHGAHAPMRLGCPHLGPASPRAPPNAKRVLRHYTRLG